MNHAIRIHEYGGPEKMLWEEVPLPAPKPGEALVRHTAVGLNYIDVYFRTGLYKAPSLPAVIGMEAAGVVEAVGEGVTEVAPGDRVAYGTGPIGAYSEARVVRADLLVKLPPAIADETAAAMMLQGMTAQYLLHRTFPVKAGQTILVHAAAGGVGLILCQWAKALGCTVIGTVSTPEKAELARGHGASHVILPGEDLPQRVKEITGGAMLPVVYDSVGKDTFMASLDCLAPLGTMVTYGNASGPVPPVDPGLLAAKGSLFLTRPTLATYTAKRADMVASAESLFGAVETGKVEIVVNQHWPLHDAAEAHRALEARRTMGSTVFIPG
ncbi:quinone oxidoreductase [Roseomonas gilardii]|uniref:Quinone oxidoreductase n=1 Tax=Roseomonas gilardii TaxID=257708 RepID=A0A1L7AJ98_9PROT|nr:quinone oxidoreductase [Roseomonas gilardii]APT58790.1 quinone oxidoreductase [Roseomonas gilardii]MDT8333223.1 quinone oxidoreductase [Roseomonas gilardii]PZR10099.1 MAG: quinone oxidoreductase [Azospirillum brasilense]